MPESTRLFTFAATPKYRRALKEFAKALKAEGRTIPDDPLRLAEFAIVDAALRRGIMMPERTPGIGGKRAGAGRKPKAKPKAEK
jgi:hypothetical protein